MIMDEFVCNQNDNDYFLSGLYELSELELAWSVRMILRLHSVE